MKFNSDIHHRRSIRLRGYDYSQPGIYFITVCSWQRVLMFGEVVNGEMVPNNFGEIVAQEWLQSAVKRPSICLGEYVVMPNHFHAIVIIGTNPVGARFIAPRIGTKNPVGARFIAPNHRQDPHPVGARFIAPNHRQGLMQEQGVINHAPTVGEIVRRFKARSTFHINQVRDSRGTPVWQRNYWERIVRDEEEYSALCEYIRQNPANWQKDRLYC